MQIVIKKGDITRSIVDVIVNAAKKSLEGGGGVDGAIHKAAGSGLLEACKALPSRTSDKNETIRCDTGEAVITGGFNLTADHIIHTVGPRCDEIPLKYIKRRQLHECWFNALMLTDDRNLATIAFPSISTGIFKFPINQAADIAISTIRLFEVLKGRKSSIKKVYIVCFSDDDQEVYQEAAMR